MKNFIILSLAIILIGCQSTQYTPIIDPNSGKPQEVVDNDILECTEIARTVDLSDAAAKSGMMGAAVGAGVAAGVSVAVVVNCTVVVGLDTIVKISSVGSNVSTLLSYWLGEKVDNKLNKETIIKIPEIIKTVKRNCVFVRNFFLLIGSSITFHEI